MSCLWRKNPVAPCSCAYRLEGRMLEVLNHLAILGPATLVMRGEGVSLAKTTNFGLSMAYGERDWALLHDRVSGLEADTGVDQEIHLLTDAADPRPMLLLGRPGAAAELSIRLDGRRWDSAAIRGMIRHFHGHALQCWESRQLGAGAWLDEWDRRAAKNLDDGNILQFISSSARLEVDVRTAAYRNVVEFQPAFVDHDGSVLRIADKHCQHVVYADTAAPGCEVVRKADGTAVIRGTLAS